MGGGITYIEEYSEEKYQKYVNYDAINVDKVREIPKDYYDVIGVPVTFLMKHDPKEFEIKALGIIGSCEFTSNRKMEILDKLGNPTGKYTWNGKGTVYSRWTKADEKKGKKRPAFKDVETGELYKSHYARVMIKRKRADEVK